MQVAFAESCLSLAEVGRGTPEFTKGRSRFGWFRSEFRSSEMDVVLDRSLMRCQGDVVEARRV